MSTTKITASYIPMTDKYTASVIMNEVDYIVSARNGEDLPAKVKELTGIDIEYNFNERTFTVPKENIF